MGARPEVIVSEEKRALRIEMRRRRASVSMTAREELVASLARSLGGELEARGQTDRLESVALYAAKAEEAPAAPLLPLVPEHALLAFPRVSGPRRLSFHQVSGIDELDIGTFGVREPAPSSPVVLAGALALIVIPGLAFDRTGRRLGWGAGYYDSALVEHPDALRVGVAYSTQLIDAVPTEPWDVAVDVLITEEGVIRCKPCT